MPRALALLTVVVLALLVVWLVATGDEEPASTEAPPVASVVQDEAGVERAERRRLGETSAADAEPSSAVEESDPPPCRLLRIETESGEPIPLLYLRWVAPGDGRGSAVTDWEGNVVSGGHSVGERVLGIPVADDATVQLRIGRDEHVLAPGVERLVLGETRPLRIRIVDSRTDERLGVPVLVGGEKLVDSDGGGDEFDPAAEHLRLAAGTSARLFYPRRRGLLRGPLAERQLDGFVPTSKVALAYRLTLPMRETFDVPVRWQCDDELRDPEVHVAYSADRVGSSVSSDEDGVAVTRAFPFFRGERVTATVSTDTHEGSLHAPVLVPGRQPELLVQVQETQPANVPPSNDVELPAAQFRVGVGGGAEDERPTGTLVVQAFRRDGTVAAGIDVRPGGTTDENGMVRAEGVPAGSCRVRFDEPGVVSSWTDVEVEPGVTQRVELREREGRTVTLVSRDADGAPLPYARVTVHQLTGVEYVAIDEHGVADLALWTDSQGRLTLHHLDDYDVEFTVLFGSRRVSVRADVDQRQVEAVFTPVR